MIPLPKNFLLRTRKFMGDEYDDFISSFSNASPISIRINPFKKGEIYSSEEKIVWSKEGRYLAERPSFTNDPLFHAGCYYVQDASSQFLEQPFLQAKKILNRPIRVLDLCSAPGGKSTHILSLIDEDDLLVCNEIIGSRNNVLRQNIMKWGKANVFVTQNDPSDFTRHEGFFDIVVVDAPCSGEGLFRKDENARQEWSVENVNHCAIRQQEILKHAYATLSPGGFLIYSTCTFEEVENDKQVEMLIDKFELKSIQIENVFKGIVRTKYGLIFYPHHIRGEGFYISLLQKKEENDSSYKKPYDKNEKKSDKYFKRYLNNPEYYFSLLKDERLFAIPFVHLNSFNSINRNFYIRLAGIYMGEFKGEDLIPSAALALSNQIKNEFPKIELNKEDAIEYLKGNNPKIDALKGWAIVSYKNFRLGWIKNIGTRINNYYPKEWRIKKN